MESWFISQFSETTTMHVQAIQRAEGKRHPGPNSRRTVFGQSTEKQHRVAQADQVDPARSVYANGGEGLRQNGAIFPNEPNGSAGAEPVLSEANVCGHLLFYDGVCGKLSLSSAKIIKVFIRFLCFFRNVLHHLQVKVCQLIIGR